MSLSVNFDAKQFTDRMEIAGRELKNALRRTVDKAARSARKQAVVALAKDIGVPVGAFRSSIPLVKGSTQNNLSASWTVSKKRILIALTGSNLPARGGSGLKASTFRDTGGKSAALSAPKAFTINVGGVAIVMVRNGKGRSAIKPIYAENPVAGLSQEDAAPRKVWERVAARELASVGNAEVQRALDGQSGGTSASAGE